MIISDLNHLEVVSEASGIVGGGCKCKSKKVEVMKPKAMKPKAKEYILIPSFAQSNVSVVNQTATAVSTAISFGGDANSQAIAKNEATVVQANGGY